MQKKLLLLVTMLSFNAMHAMEPDGQARSGCIFEGVARYLCIGPVAIGARRFLHTLTSGFAQGGKECVPLQKVVVDEVEQGQPDGGYMLGNKNRPSAVRKRR